MGNNVPIQNKDISINIILLYLHNLNLMIWNLLILLGTDDKLLKKMVREVL